MDVKPWNKDIKQLREIILKQDKIEESKTLALSLHSMVHSSEMSGLLIKTFEDELWEDLDEYTFRSATNEKGRTIAYGLWHSTRIEDITMNMLVSGDEQVFILGNWKEKINSTIVDTGNAMTGDEILEFSKNINMLELKNYRIAVGRKSQEIIRNLTNGDMKRKFEKHRLQHVINEGAVLDVEASNWLIDFWGRKSVSGIILMPVTRHHVVHLNESFSAKKKFKHNKIQD
ncbi:DinB family protein [Clostridium swellfunianum]|uniref:DinB family protein n=1 Tax=Clostridium swellfunianum TaxID=1367462 RepID=UPI002030BD19|nr:DinB family protein [Clostridium swellfunianum]MCM0650269.1 DinB family protein [Clostridium swellfunianum]